MEENNTPQTEEKKSTELKLVEIQQSVRDLVKLEYSAEDLQKMVEVSLKITVPNLEDKEQLKIAKEMRTKLRKAEIVIEKEAKSYRDFFTKINKDIRAEELSLIDITKGEIERLDKIQEEADALELKKEREAMLPVRKERLLKIDPSGCYICFDENLLDMDAMQFETYYNNCVANFNERQRVLLEEQAEAKRKEEADKLAKERFDFRVEKLLSIGLQKDDVFRGYFFEGVGITDMNIQDLSTEEFDKQFAVLQTSIANKREEAKQKAEKEARRGQLPDRKAKLEAIGDAVPVSDDVILGMDDNQFDAYVNKRVADKNEADKKAIEDKKKADEEAKAEKERKEAEEKAEKERKEAEEKAEQDRIDNEEKERREATEKKEAYKKFLKDHGWTPETRDQFESRSVKGGFELWQKVGFFENY